MLSGGAAAADGSRLSIDITGQAEIPQAEGSGGETIGIPELINNSAIHIRAGETEENTGLLNAAIEVGGSEIFSLIAASDDENGAVAFQVPQAGSNIYSISQEKLSDLLMSSASADGASNIMGLDPNALVPDISPELLTEAFNPIIADASEHFAEALQMEEGVDVDLPKLGATVLGCTVYTCEPTAEQVESLLNNIGEGLRNNEAMDQLVEGLSTYIRSLDGVLSVTAVAGQEMNAEEAADALLEVYNALPDMMLENAAAIGEEIENSNMKANIAITEDGAPCMVEILSGSEDGEKRIAFEMDMSDSFDIYVGEEADGEETMAKASFTMDGQTASGDLSLISSEDDTNLLLTFAADISTLSKIGIPYGSMIINTPESMCELVVEVGNKEDTDLHTIKISSSEGDGIAFTFNIETGNEAPDKDFSDGDIVDISEYSPEEISSLLSGIGMSVASAFMPSAE